MRYMTVMEMLEMHCIFFFEGLKHVQSKVRLFGPFKVQVRVD